MNKQEVITLLREPNGSEKLAFAEEALSVCLELVKTKEPSDALGPALSYLARSSKRKAFMERILASLSKRELEELLSSDSFKVRKNTARLLSHVAIEGMDKVLAETLTRETVRMVRPSLILALGSMATPFAMDFLASYQVEAPKEGEEKHAKAEEEALKKALDQPGQNPRHAFLGWPTGTRLRLTCAKGLEGALESEILEKNAGKILKRGQGWSLVEVTDPKRIMGVRTWQEILLPLKGVSPSDIVRETDSFLEKVLEKGTKSSKVGFRVEMTKDREELKELAGKIEEASLALTGAFQLINRTSDYEVEIRILGKEGPVFLKLWNVEENRFFYRQEAIPASIHPSNAAGLMRYADLSLRKLGRKPKKGQIMVLDPCCGSATLLYERMMLSKERREALPYVVGLDKEQRALEAASKNAKALEEGLQDQTYHPRFSDATAGNRDQKTLPLRLVKGDLAVFAPKRSDGSPLLFDEIYANLPFGIRVGDHEENIKIYPRLVKNLPQWLAPEGFAVLYTMEGSLLKRLLSEEKSLAILTETKIQAGGLEPKVFIVIKNNR